MDNALNPLLELSRDPVLVLEGGTIFQMNPAARQAFPGIRIGDRAVDLIPDLIAFEPAERFVTSAAIAGVQHTVSAVRCGETLYLALTEERPAAGDRGCLSEGIMSGMLSTLFNIGLSSGRIRDTLPQDADEARRYLAILDHSYYSLVRRLRNLNALMAFVDGSMALSFCRVDLVALCQDIVASTSLLTGAACASLEFRTELDSLFACMDAPKIEQLILNLLTNSLKHTPPDGSVRLMLAQSGANALLSVRDNGSGIPPARLNSVFTGFRARQDLETLCAESGDGLGLGLCRLIAEKHGGMLILESREGEGTDVRVLLPLTQPGTMELLNAGPVYSNGGISVLLTELSELLDAGVYEEFCGD